MKSVISAMGSIVPVLHSMMSDNDHGVLVLGLIPDSALLYQ